MFYGLPSIFRSLTYLLVLVILPNFLPSAVVLCKAQRQVQFKWITKSLLVINLLLVWDHVGLVFVLTVNGVNWSKPLVHDVCWGPSWDKRGVSISVNIDRRISIRSVWLVRGGSGCRWEERTFCIHAISLFIIWSLCLVKLLFDSYFNWLHVNLSRSGHTILLLAIVIINLRLFNHYVLLNVFVLIFVVQVHHEVVSYNVFIRTTTLLPNVTWYDVPFGASWTLAAGVTALHAAIDHSVDDLVSVVILIMRHSFIVSWGVRSVSPDIVVVNWVLVISLSFKKSIVHYFFSI